MDDLSKNEGFTFGELSKEVTFFTPALLLVRGEFDRDPISEFRKELNPPADQMPFAIDVPLPIFQGLGSTLMGGYPVNWDNRLYGVATDYWQAFYDFMLAITAIDRRKPRYWRTISHGLTIVDPIALKYRKQESIPTVDIIVFCPSAVDGLYHLAPATDPPRTRAFPVRGEPNPDIVKEGLAVLQRTQD